MFPVLRNHSMLAPLGAGPINRMDTLFDRFFGTDGEFLSRAWAGVPVALWEDEDSLHVEAELPGVTDQDVDITVHNGLLFIRGERKPAEGRNYLYNGRSYGRFERVITLPEAVRTDDVQARLTDGVLCLTLPKSPEAKPKKIALRTS
jgi:HSP20 family protein